MLNGVKRRGRKAGLEARLETIQCTTTDLGLAPYAGQVDLAAAVHMIHEVPHRRAFLDQVIAALKPGGKFLIMEPRGHVSEEDFNRTLRLAREAGLIEQPLPFKAHTKALAALFSL